MTKEKESLEGMFNLIKSQSSFEEAQKYYDILDEAINRLEAIDNANPSEALECLDKLLDGYSKGMAGRSYYDTIKQALLKAQEQEKVLSIMFTKTVSIFQLSCCKNVDEYNDLKFNDNEKLTKDEFDLLKRWLG